MSDEFFSIEESAGGGADGIDSLDSDGKSESKVVTARGTEDGLVLRIDGKAEWQEILHDIELFLGGRKKFFEGGQVSLEWLDRLPTVEQGKELEELLRTGYGVELIVKRKRPSKLSVAARAALDADPAAERVLPGTISSSGSSGSGANRGEVSGETMSTRKTKRTGVTINLFDELQEGSAGISSGGPAGGFLQGDSGIGSSASPFGSGSGFSSGSLLSSSIEIRSEGGKDDFSDELTGAGKKYASRMARMLGDDLFYEDDANAKVFFGTLRSGQRLETPFSLIVVGDVNPGADLVAGGDILVFGGLRGTAHASAYDDDSFDRVIIALQMQPMQLRIGSVISRGSDEVVRGAEIARIENRRIIVEAFNPRALLGNAMTGGMMGKKFR